MDDNVMVTWSVIESAEGYTDTIHICARHETAEYLRDWCEALEYDRVLNCLTRWPCPETAYHRDSFLRGMARFSIDESEVIL